MSGKRDSALSLADIATVVEHTQLRVGVHTTLPVSERFKSIALQMSQLGSGGCFSRLPPEMIPEVAKHLTSTQDLLHFSLTNKGIHFMLLHNLFKAELTLAKNYTDGLILKVHQSQKVPFVLARDLVEQYPQTRPMVQTALHSIVGVLEPAQASLQADLNYLQDAMREHVKPIKMMMQCTDPEVKALSIQEKHALVLHMLSNVPGKAEAVPFIERVKTIVSQVTELIDNMNQTFEEQFADVQARLVAQLPLPPQLPAQLPPES